MSNYYYLVAGLPEITLEDSKLSLEMPQLRDELMAALTPKDAKLLALHFLKYDNRDLLRFLENREATLEGLGCYTATEFQELLTLAEESDDLSGTSYPSYLFGFLQELAQERKVTEGQRRSAEDILSSYFGDYLLKANHPFFQAWFELNQNINNIFAALAARKFGLEVASVVVGDNAVANQLRSSNLRDFGLTNTVDYLSQLVKIFEEGDLVERERQLDLFRWSWIEEESALSYFSVEVLFAFVLKHELVDRWLKLDKITGEQMFRRLIAGLKDEVVLPEEFK